MPYVTTLERIIQEEGIRVGLLRGIEDMLEVRFGSEGKKLLPEIAQITDVDLLDTIRLAARNATSLDDVRKAMSK